MRDVLPPEIFESIQGHLIESGNTAHGGWEDGGDEEDTLTGDLFAQMRTKSWVNQFVRDDEWRWRIRFKKFRGRGRGAFERHSGADGVIQIEIEPHDRSPGIYKGLLFQAKKRSIRRPRTGLADPNLREQVEKMEAIAPGGSAVFVYGPDGYTAIDGNGLGRIEAEAPNPQPLGSFLGDAFLGCRSGMRGMYYEAPRRLLIVPARGEILAYRTDLDYRLQVEIEINPPHYRYA